MSTRGDTPPALADTTDWKSIRISAGYKRPALARRLNVHPATIDRFEKHDPIQGETTRARLALEYRKLAAEVAEIMALPIGVSR